MIDEYHFRVWSAADDDGHTVDWASWGGLRVSARRAVVPELARRIVALGGPSLNLAAPVRVYAEHNGGKLGGARSLGALAGENT